MRKCRIEGEIPSVKFLICDTEYRRVATCQKNRRTKNNELKANLPGGEVHVEETPIAAAWRELAGEELVRLPSRLKKPLHQAELLLSGVIPTSKPHYERKRVHIFILPLPDPCQIWTRPGGEIKNFHVHDNWHTALLWLNGMRRTRPEALRLYMEAMNLFGEIPLRSRGVA